MQNFNIMINKEISMKITSILKEFREFALKGNVVDMAVGIIIGAAFGKIVTSLVNDVIVGGVDFKDLKFVLKAAKGNAPAVTLNYGNFIQCTIDFIIVAIAIFAVIKAMNALRTLAIKEKKEADEITPPEPTKEEALLTEIRDILKEKNK